MKPELFSILMLLLTAMNILLFIHAKSIINRHKERMKRQTTINGSCHRIDMMRQTNHELINRNMHLEELLKRKDSELDELETIIRDKNNHIEQLKKGNHLLNKKLNISDFIINKIDDKFKRSMGK